MAPSATRHKIRTCRSCLNGLRSRKGIKMPVQGHEVRPSLDTSSIASSEPPWSLRQPAQIEDALPASYQLIVTTTSGVYTWSRGGISQIFRSGSEGIVAARKIDDNNDILAVADSHVVILHDIEKGMQKSYRLKGSEGQVRLLKYAGNSSKNLYFTTTLRNSVQSYSLQHSKVLDPADSHPSPPSVFAISCSSHLLLSTSASPPTIYIRNLRTSAAPILLQPQCSSSAVVAADFHPESPTIFLLAFADGTAAAYDASRIFLDGGLGQPIERPGSSGVGSEIGYIQRLHAVGSKVVNDGLTTKGPANEIHYDSQIRMSGITAVALVPGHRALGITVGADGKCCVVDFTQPTRTRALLVRTWRLRSPATSLSVVYCGYNYTENQVNASSQRRIAINKEYRVAIGRQDGKVLLFDLDGQALAKCIVDTKGARVVDVEWAKKETSGAFPENRPGLPSLALQRALPKESSLDTEVFQSQPPQDDILNVAGSPNTLVEPTSSLETMASGSPKSGFGNLGSLEAPTSGTSNGSVSNSRAEILTKAGEREDFDSPPEPSDSFSTVSSNSDSRASSLLPLNIAAASPPPIPPRPSPKAGGKLSLKRALTARENKGSMPCSLTSTADPRRAMTVSGPRSPSHAGTVALRTQKERPSGPRQPPGKSDWKTRPKSPAIYVTPKAEVDMPPKDQAPDGLNLGPRFPPANGKPSTQSVSCRAPRASFESLLSASVESFKTASTHLHYPTNGVSDTSNESVVDWSTPASSRRPMPSPRHSIPQLSSQIPYFQDRSQSPVTLPNVAAEKAELSGVSTYKMDNGTDVVAPASVLGPPPPLPKREKRRRKKKKGHESTNSVPASASLSLTSAPSSSSISTIRSGETQGRHDPIDDTINQWSTNPAPPLRQPPPPPPPLPARSAPLKKSPRVTDLSAGVESSVTANVLDEGGYGIDPDRGSMPRHHHHHPPPPPSSTPSSPHHDAKSVTEPREQRDVNGILDQEHDDDHDESRGNGNGGGCRCADAVRNVVRDELRQWRAEMRREMVGLREAMMDLARANTNGAV